VYDPSGTVPNVIERVSTRDDWSAIDHSMRAKHMRDIFLAGYDTSISSLTSTIYFVVNTPRVHQKLRDEIRSTFRKLDEVSPEAVEALPYLDAVISETLRVYPPVSMAPPRRSPGAFVDGFYVPEGVEVGCPIFALTHNPDYFADPYAFLPERWMPGSELGDNLSASQPFGVGPTSCLGKP
jgi:cytochrome P450